MQIFKDLETAQIVLSDELQGFEEQTGFDYTAKTDNCDDTYERVMEDGELRVVLLTILEPDADEGYCILVQHAVADLLEDGSRNLRYVRQYLFDTTQGLVNKVNEWLPS